MVDFGNPTGRLRGSRNKLSEEVICALLRDFRKHGEKAIAKVRREQPGVYLRCLTLLIPREHKVEHSDVIKSLSDQELEDMIEYIKTSLEAQAGGPVKVIEGMIEPAAAIERDHLFAYAVATLASLYDCAKNTYKLRGPARMGMPLIPRPIDQ